MMHLKTGVFIGSSRSASVDRLLARLSKELSQHDTHFIDSLPSEYTPTQYELSLPALRLPLAQPFLPSRERGRTRCQIFGQRSFQPFK